MNALSIDLEDWYHSLRESPADWRALEDRVSLATRQLLGILKETGTRATFFVLGDVAERHPDLVREIQSDGHEVGSHGYAHQFVYRQSPEEFEADVKLSLSLLTSILGCQVLGYRAPYFSITRSSLWARPILRKLGLAYDSSVFPVINHRYGIPDAPRLPYRTAEGLLEVPLSTYPLGRLNVPFCGGVYFRFLPYAVVRQMMRRLERRGEPVVFYLHPWEIDAQQPRIPLPLGLKLRHYWNLAETADKLRRLLNEFRFTSIRDVVKL